MNRRSFLASTALATAGAMVVTSPATASPRRGTSTNEGPRGARSHGSQALQARNFTPIRRGVGHYISRGGTMGYLATADALVVVDTQYPDTAAEALSGLTERTGRRVDLLINTHHHGDHTAGNAVMAAVADRFVAHENVPTLQLDAAARADNGEVPTMATSTFATRFSAQVGDEIVQMHHFGPAHTGGDSVVYFQNADIVHMGDLVFNRMPPFIDQAGGASVSGWVDLLETVHAAYSDNTVFVYGHGNPDYGVVGTREDLLVMRDFLSGLMEYVQSGIGGGSSVEELASIDRLPDFPEHYRDSWQAAIPNAIRAAHQELTDNN